MKSDLLRKLIFNIRPAFLASFLKKLFNVKREIVETEKGKFYIDPISNFGSTLLENGVYEPTMIKTLEYYLNSTSIFMDIGANEGYFSVIASQIVGLAGKVISIEPQKRLKSVLKKNFSLNKVENAVLYPLAISDCKNQVPLYISPDTNTGSTALIQSTQYKLPTEIIDTITLEELFSLAKVEKVDLIKMDIEGFEYEAILGSPKLFSEKRVKALALEIHPKILSERGLDPGVIVSFLNECGYQLDARFSNTVFTCTID